ncbi:hypothetical protein [Desulfovibrio sp. UIB00]|uniref:hypothetical protein n=1 Tax=Desulfovibrio sp. UIB00 TaxID=2804314 RepID=UPI001F11348A|nr:hypothetical protein [Desulfovibrio sp. UIB00]
MHGSAPLFHAVTCGVFADAAQARARKIPHAIAPLVASALRVQTPFILPFSAE